MKVKLLDPGMELPAYARKGDAGFDLRAALPEGETLMLGPGDRALIPTGVAFGIPQGMEVQIRPRSGLALKHGITIVNAPGTIDSGYRGEVKVILMNLSSDPFYIVRGDRIAQAVYAPVYEAEFEFVEELDETDRGEGGFGSSGVK